MRKMQTSVSFTNTILGFACKAANHCSKIFLAVMQEINYYGFYDCAGVAALVSKDMVMPQEVNKNLFGKHVLAGNVFDKAIEILYFEKSFTDAYDFLDLNSCNLDMKNLHMKNIYLGILNLIYPLTANTTCIACS